MVVPRNRELNKTEKVLFLLFSIKFIIKLLLTTLNFFCIKKSNFSTIIGIKILKGQCNLTNI